MSVTEKNETLRVISERHAVKKYEKGFVMPEADLNAILTAASEAPSAWNLQHWRFLVIESEADKAKLLPIAYGQTQVVDSSVTIAVLGDLEANRNTFIYDQAVEAGALPAEVRDTLVGQINGVYQNPQIARDEAIRNASFASQNIMLAARSLGYDTCPMGGYNPQQLIEAFNIPARFVPTLLITVGKAAEPARPSGRFPLSEVVVKGSF
ncbi:nitroreductase family protein [Paenibacillus silvae]|jgi:nitroreductase|uniref:nitroreductase family protein n=1 Tax=Paenibacillus TaxID=44249 RepID=UPI001C105B4C|nr:MULTISPECIES: nitroreductase family protein [Paenibacillus]MBU5354978.1 nitroreductase family protein [Paenibacillus barcinonensis]MDM5280166.1 nitroreductase family protein [Paenibacillus silvae]